MGKFPNAFENTRSKIEESITSQVNRAVTKRDHPAFALYIAQFFETIDAEYGTGFVAHFPRPAIAARPSLPANTRVAAAHDKVCQLIMAGRATLPEAEMCTELGVSDRAALVDLAFECAQAGPVTITLRDGQARVSASEIAGDVTKDHWKFMASKL